MLSAGGVKASPCEIPKFTGERAKQLTPTETGGSDETHLLSSNDKTIYSYLILTVTSLFIFILGQSVIFQAVLGIQRQHSYFFDIFEGN